MATISQGRCLVKKVSQRRTRQPKQPFPNSDAGGCDGCQSLFGRKTQPTTVFWRPRKEREGLTDTVIEGHWSRQWECPQPTPLEPARAACCHGGRSWPKDNLPSLSSPSWAPLSRQAGLCMELTPPPAYAPPMRGGKLGTENSESAKAAQRVPRVGQRAGCC